MGSRESAISAGEQAWGLRLAGLRRKVRPMLRQESGELRVATQGRGFYEITEAVAERVRTSGLKTGLCTIFVEHTSASLLIQENADPGVRRDLERFFARFVPDGDALFEHTAEGEDDMPAHIRAAVTAVSLGIPIVRGALTLGTWQGIYLWEHRTHPHRRRLTVHLVGE